MRVVDPETYQDVADGQQGVILAQGPGVMKGYYNDPQGTQKAFKDVSWFDTGDLGWRAPGLSCLIVYQSIIEFMGSSVTLQLITCCARCAITCHIVCLTAENAVLCVRQDTDFSDGIQLLESDNNKA